MTVVNLDNPNALLIAAFGQDYEAKIKERASSKTSEEVLESINKKEYPLTIEQSIRVEFVSEVKKKLSYVQIVLSLSIYFIINRIKGHYDLLSKIYPSLKGRVATSRIQSVKHLLLVLAVAKVFYDFIRALYVAHSTNQRLKIIGGQMLQYVGAFAMGIIPVILPPLSVLNPLQKGVSWQPKDTFLAHMQLVINNKKNYFLSWTVGMFPAGASNIEVDTKDFTFPVDQAARFVFFRLLPVLVLRQVLTTHAQTLFSAESSN